MKTAPLKFGQVLVGAALLYGCQATDYLGSGPLVLNASQQRHFASYKNKDTSSKYFMVTTDKRGTFNFYCEDITGCQMSPGQATSLCEMHHGKPCKLYAEGNDVVWRFSGPTNTFTSDSTYPPGIPKVSRARLRVQ